MTTSDIALTKHAHALPSSLQQSSSTSSPAIMAGLSEKFSKVQKIAHRRNSDLVVQWLIGKTALSDVSQIERARQWVKIIPARDRLSEDYELLHDAVFKAASTMEIRLVFIPVLDAIPHAHKSATHGYIENVIFSLQHADDDHDDTWTPGNGFSLPALHTAARRILMNHKFTPSISEIVQATRIARDEFWKALKTTQRLIELRLSAEDVIDEVEIEAGILTCSNDDPNSLPF